LKFNTKTRYGIRTIVEIALRGQEGIYQKEIARNQNISFKYLDQIISALKAADLIANVKGKKSGYVLKRPPEAILIYDVYQAFNTGICIVECLDGNFHCKAEYNCPTRFFWEGLNEVIIDYFKKYTVKDLVEKHKQNG